MLDRFRGPIGARRLEQLIGEQDIVRYDPGLTGAILRVLAADDNLLASHAQGEELIEQGEPGQGYHLLLLTGRVALYRNGNRLVEIPGGHSFGEFPILDPKLTHKVTIKVLEETVVARLPENMLRGIGEQHPRLWENMAAMLARRLRETGDRFWPPKDPPLVFVGSSVEGLEVARALENGLEHDAPLLKVWTNGVFNASRSVMEDLMNEVYAADFAVLIATPDDEVTRRGETRHTIRDNVLFELGLFMGRLGRDRTLLVLPRGVDIRVPTDLLGVTVLEYRRENSGEVNVGPVVNKIRARVKELRSLEATEVLANRGPNHTRR